jgi:hypothetical protein
MTQRGRQPIAARDTEQPNVTSSLASLVVWPSLLGLTTHEGTHQPYWPCGPQGARWLWPGPKMVQPCLPISAAVARPSANGGSPT